MAEKKTYEYTPLLEDTAIRVLDLQPGWPHEPIHITVSSIIHDDPSQSYDALSYTWGDPTPVHDIDCNGSAFWVAESLFIALSGLRSELVPLTLWIDAICINQNDGQERNHQVQLMGSIYSMARRVLVWTGKDDQPSRIAFQLFRDLASHWNAQPTNVEYIGKYLNMEAMKFFNNDNYDIKMDSLETYFNRAWFKRAWTFQEICLARDAVLICGEDSIYWPTFHDALSLLFSMQASYGNPQVWAPTLQTIDGYWNYLRVRRVGDTFQQGDTLRLSYLLRRTEEQLATNPRDRIYSLLGFSALKGEGYLQPDYSQSVRDVYLQFTRLCIKNDKYLGVLSDTYRRESEEPLYLPSWAPDWRECSKTYPISMRSDSNEPKYNINRSLEVTQIIYSSGNEDLLCMRGVVFDNVNVVFTIESLLSDLSNIGLNNAAYHLFHIFREIQQHLRLPDIYEITGEDFVIAMLRTLTADSIGGWGRIREEARFGDMDPYSLTRLMIKQDKRNANSGSKNLLSRSRKYDTTDGGRTEEFTNSEMIKIFTFLATREPVLPTEHNTTTLFRSFKRAVSLQGLQDKTKTIMHARNGLNFDMVVQPLMKDILRWSKGRAMFATERGFIGTAPESVVSGDKVCTFLGGDVAYVLRGIGEDGDVARYSLVGESYVHGVMDGELWRDELDDNGDPVPMNGAHRVEIIVLS